MQRPRIHVKCVLFTDTLFQLNDNGTGRLTDRNFEFIEMCVAVAYFKEGFLQDSLCLPN